MSDNLHLPPSVASNDDVFGGLSYTVNLAWITLQVSHPACFGHVLAVLAQCPAKRLHASLHRRLMSGLMGLSDTPVSAPVCFCLSERGWISVCLSVSDFSSAATCVWLFVLFPACASHVLLLASVCLSTFLFLISVTRARCALSSNSCPSTAATGP